MTEDGSTTTQMTTSDDGHLSGLPSEETPEGTVMPNIRGRLRSRLPARIRTARGQLLVLAGYLLLAPIIVAILAVTGALAKMNLATQDIVGATLGNLVVAILCVVAGRLLLRRSLFGYWLAVGDRRPCGRSRLLGDLPRHHRRPGPCRRSRLLLRPVPVRPRDPRRCGPREPPA